MKGWSLDWIQYYLDAGWSSSWNLRLIKFKRLKRGRTNMTTWIAKDHSELKRLPDSCQDLNALFEDVSHQLSLFQACTPTSWKWKLVYSQHIWNIQWIKGRTPKGAIIAPLYGSYTSWFPCEVMVLDWNVRRLGGLTHTWETVMSSLSWRTAYWERARSAILDCPRLKSEGGDQLFHAILFLKVKFACWDWIDVFCRQGHGKIDAPTRVANDSLQPRNFQGSWEGLYGSFKTSQAGFWM